MSDAEADALLDAPLADIARNARERPDLARALADAALARIRRRDVGIRAVVATVDRPVVAPGRGPLAGVPYLLKDLQADAADLPLRRGSRTHATAVPTTDSTLVSRLRTAGVTILGRTHSPEFGLGISTESALHGATANPWDPTRSAGGSSGGAAAAVAAGLVPAAHATDSGGSIRIPAAWCGVVGFKPSRGLVPAGPVRRDDWFGLSHEHAITRTVDDTRLLLEATAGSAPGEWNPAPERRAVPRVLRIGLLDRAPGGREVDPAWAAAARTAADVFADAGHEVVRLSPVDEAARIGPLFGAIAGAHIAHLLDRGGYDDALLEPAVAEVVERARRLRATDLVRAAADMHELGFEIASRFAAVDLVLSPTTDSGPPALGELTAARSATDLFSGIFSLSPFAAMFNVTGGAAISVPWGRGPDGMPLAVHLGGAIGDDDLVLSAAETLDATSPALTRLTPPAR